MTSPNWICCQLGAREHYAVPRALEQSGQLAALVTDAWVPPQSMLNRLPQPTLRGLRDRYHPDLAKTPVKAFTPDLLKFEFFTRLKRSPSSWEQMIGRNQWFQKKAVRSLKVIDTHIEKDQRPVLFVYSYAALHLLEFAKQAGWITVLGQIDPGVLEEQIVIQEYEKHSDLATGWQKIPSDYWERWQKECELADHIVVNSKWSKHLLQKANVCSDKIEVVPLVYQPPQNVKIFERTYPVQFTSDRPLRVLFLGLVTLRKGIAAILEAVQKLTGEPVEFWIVGPVQVEISEALKNHPQVNWTGAVPRSHTANYYRQADVFLFPTLSDGFGLTQLEAQSWQLPIIASPNCGEVVEDSKNGLILSEVTATEIAKAITYCYQNPKQLSQQSRQAVIADRFQISSLPKHLQQVVNNHY